MQCTSFFDAISKKDIARAGGKGASLGEMTQAGIEVPPGFVVLASAFENVLTATVVGADIAAILKKVNPQDLNSVEEAAEQIQAAIQNIEIPQGLAKEIQAGFMKLDAKYVAVRSSATAEDSKSASWAGELETYLNTTSTALLQNIRNCWASLYSPRAIFYRFEKGMAEMDVSVAVVVQAMIQAEISGICFTVHPVTQDHNQLVIESGYGLGEAIVGGMITPDTYVIHKKTYEILEKHISQQEKQIVKQGTETKEARVPAALQEQQKLTNTEILKLAKLCQKIEQHYRHPQDIEWALYKGKMYILQSRPITTLTK